MSEELEGRLVESRISLGPAALSELYEQGYFGRPRGRGLELSLVEAAYLLDRSRIRVLSDGGELDFPALFQRASSLERGFEFRYVVYKDLRERGYYVQPGRPDFRVYPRGGRPGKSPAEFYVLVISERMPLPLEDIMQPVRMAGQMRKRLMLAIVDEESDITFYEARERSMAGVMAGMSPEQPRMAVAPGRFGGDPLALPIVKRGLAVQRSGNHRSRRWRCDDRHATCSGADVCGFRRYRHGSDIQPGGENPVHVRWKGESASCNPHAGGYRETDRSTALQQP